MKKNIFNHGLVILIMLLHATVSDAQTKPDTQRSSKTRESVKLNYESDDSQGTGIINYSDGQQTFKIKMKNDKIIELYVDDKKIAEENYNVYQDKIVKILAEVKVDREKAELDQQRSMRDQQRAKLNQERALSNHQLAEENEIQMQRHKQQAEKDQLRNKNHQYQLKKTREQEEWNKQQSEKYAIQSQKYKLQAEEDQQRAIKDMKQSKEYEIRSRKEAERAEVDARHAEEDKRTVENLLDDLVKEHIVSDKKEVFSVVINENEFSVNGKKQSDDLHKKFKAIYLKKKGTKINYTYRNFSINNE